MGKQVYSPYAWSMLGILFFIEAIFFLPVDPILILYCIEYPANAWVFATIATCASVLGGIVGYVIGYAFWQVMSPFILGWVISPETFDKAVLLFREWQMIAIIIGGFTPIPYKAVTYTAGVCQLPLLPFIFYSWIARGARFYLVALLVAKWGAQVKDYIDRYFNILVLLFIIIMLLAAGCTKFIYTWLAH
jgi:membrane protein YqaA with SNARE-associated domain